MDAHDKLNLKCTNLSKKYDKDFALDNVNLELPANSIAGLLGPNGSGKTTFMKIAAGLLTPTSGNIHVCGYKPGVESKLLISYQPDKIYLNDWMNVRQLIAMMKDFYPNFSTEKAMDMLKDLKIDPLHKLKTMSKGTKEKVQLILTKSLRVPLYILDEPIGGVAPTAREYILNTILTNYKENSTVLISTHLISEIEEVADYAIFIKYGKIIRSGRKADIEAETGKSLNDFFMEEFKC